MLILLSGVRVRSSLMQKFAVFRFCLVREITRPSCEYWMKIFRKVGHLLIRPVAVSAKVSLDALCHLGLMPKSLHLCDIKFLAIFQ